MIRSRTVETPTVSATVRELTVADISLLLHENCPISCSNVMRVIPEAIRISETADNIVSDDISKVWNEFISLNSEALTFNEKSVETRRRNNAGDSFDRSVLIIIESIGVDVWGWPYRLINQYSGILKERSRDR